MLKKVFGRVPLYVRAGIVTSCVAMLFGLDTGTIGPVTAMTSFKATFGDFSSTLHGVIVSSILVTGALSSLVAGILADRHGRTRIASLGAFIYGVGGAVECGAPLLGVFILGRLIKGVGEGLFLSNVFVQITETSPARVRGIMTAMPQFATTLGIVIGFFMCYGTVRLGGSDSSAAAASPSSSVAWRLPLAVGSLLAFLAAAGCAFVPPSPRWLLARGDIARARHIVGRLGLDPADEAELLEQPEAELEEAAGLSFWANLAHLLRSFGEAFAAPFRARTAFGCFLMAMQQLSGIDGVLYYAPVLFRQAGLAGEQATFLASGVSALVIMAVTIPATLFADHWGRKTSSLVGGSLITLLMLLIGSLYASDSVRGAGRWVVIVSIYLFALVYAGTWAIGFRAFLVESLPRKTRSSASSLAQSSNWIANYVVALTTPVLISTSSFGAYYLFAGCTLLCTTAIALYMFETRGHSLERIEQRYGERMATARATGRWSVSGFRLRRLQVHNG